MKTQEFLEHIHKQIGQVSGEIVIALTLKKITNGRTAMKRWAQQLRSAANTIDEQTNEKQQATNGHANKTIDR
jgi:hypothetical protein